MSKVKEFFLEDVAIIRNGVRLTKADMQPGDMPFIGASEMNNGLTAFTSSRNDSLDSNVLGVNYNGSVGFSFYHPYKAVFSDDVKRVVWKEEQHNNKWTLLFLSTVIGYQKDKYAYGYKFNGQRMKRQKILLPVTSQGIIDWDYMEELMKKQEQVLIKKTVDKLCKRLIYSEINGGGVIFVIFIGRNSISPMYLKKYSVASGSKKAITKRVICPMFHQRPLTMVSMAS